MTLPPCASATQATDIGVCIAADDGVMPQTIEAINHARRSSPSGD
jgi:translation initiation factor IF-2